MKRILLAMAIATAAAGASAQVTFSGGTDQLISGVYNPSGTTSVQTGGKRDALLSTSAGILTATFLGFEAQDTDTFLTMASGTLTNKTAIPGRLQPLRHRARGSARFHLRRSVHGWHGRQRRRWRRFGSVRFVRRVRHRNRCCLRALYQGRSVRLGHWLQRLAPSRWRLRRFRHRLEGHSRPRARELCPDACGARSSGFRGPPPSVSLRPDYDRRSNCRPALPAYFLAERIPMCTQNPRSRGVLMFGSSVILNSARAIARQDTNEESP